MKKNNIPIIYYHSVAPNKNQNWFKKYLTLELKYFEIHLRYFVQHNYHFINLNDYWEMREQNHLEGRYVCITFDDGYVDNFIYVYPLLKMYKAKATIFINPIFVDNRSIIRKNLEEYWNNKASLEEIDNWGFLSWDEMHLMEQNGIVDIQSHTMTHLKYSVSDNITGFHHPGADCLYAIGNIYPEELPYYIDNRNFEKLIPFGYPFFEGKSSILANKVTINPVFLETITQVLKRHNWFDSYNFNDVLNKVTPVYMEFKRNSSIVQSVESLEEYQRRVYYELKETKDIIDKKLNKIIQFCCWPHGDNNEYVHRKALELGYRGTTVGNSIYTANDPTRFNRFGLGQSFESMFLTKQKINYKLKSFQAIQPYYTIKNIYEFLRDLK